MEEKKRKKQEVKHKKDTAQKKAAHQTSIVPEPAPSKLSPGPSHRLHPASPGLPLSSSSSANGQRARSSQPLATACPGQQPSPASGRYPPRDVPPRFHHQEHRQLLKRSQPLPLGTLPSSSPPPPCTSTAGSHQPDVSLQSGPGAQYEPSHCRYSLPSEALLILDGCSAAVPCCSASASCSSQPSNSSCTVSMASGPAARQAHYSPVQGNTNKMAGPGASSRGWGPDGKQDLMNVERSVAPGSWGSPTFNLNLNPNANPTAWPVLGPGGLPTSSPPPAVNGNMANGEPTPKGGWAGTMNLEDKEQHAPPSSKRSFSMEPAELNADAPNHSQQQEPMSPPHALPGWGGHSPKESSQLNGEPSGSTAWGSGEHKGDSRVSAELSSWGLRGQWGKAPIAADCGSGAKETQTCSWDTAPASEGDGNEVRPGHKDRPSSMDTAPALPRHNLDPRVLCNSGWGQTPVRQHTIWEMEEAGPNGKSHTADPCGGSSSSSGPPANGGPLTPKHGAGQRPGSGGQSDNSGGSSSSGWGATPSTQSSQPRPGWGAPPLQPSKAPSSAGGWGEPMSTNSPKGGGPSPWVSEDKSPSWDDSPAKSQSADPKSVPSWGDSSGDSNVSSAGEWGEPQVKNVDWEPEEAPRAVCSGWGEAALQQHSRSSSSSSSTGSGEGGGDLAYWGSPGCVQQRASSCGSQQEQGMEPTGWEEPSPLSLRRKMEMDDGTSTWGDPSAYNKTVNMWDRNKATSKTGSMMMANNLGSSRHSVGPGNSHHHPHHMHHSQPPPHPPHHGNNNGSPHTPAPLQEGGPQGRPPLANPGWGELPSVQLKSEPAWGEPATPSSAVDNGTLAWGKPPAGMGGWGDGGYEPSGPYGRPTGPHGSTPCKPSNINKCPKPMQDGWGGRGEEMGMSTSQWDTDDGDMLNRPTSQESIAPWSNVLKKGPSKGKLGNKVDEVWIMNRLIKQLTDMGFPRDPAEEALKSNNMNLDQAMSALLEKKSELDKRSMGMSAYTNGMSKPLCRPSGLSKDPSDRNPFMDKDGVLTDYAPPSPFLPSPGLKLPLVNSSHPGQGLGQTNPVLAMQNLNNRQMPSGMFGSSGAAQARSTQPPQPAVPPLSTSQPSLRAQVPQFLSPQVQAQLLQFAAKYIGLNPALLTSPINPQQMTLLYQLQQLQMAYQRLQIQQQMMQAQRNVSGPVRQQEQQVARTITNMQQQIQQHQRQLYQALLTKQQQQQPPPSHSSSGPAAKSPLEPFPGPSQAPSLSDALHTKEPLAFPNTYSNYPLSGLNPNMNVNCMEVGGPHQPQSRLSQWTHPNSINNFSGSSTHMETNLNKHGAIVAASALGPSGKPPQLEDSYSPYNMMSSSESTTSPLVGPDSWGQGKSPGEKISNGANINWPPEFCPGVPWKGLQNIDPENDPNMTPGSVPSGPTINTNIHDVNKYLLRDRSRGKLSDMKSTWSPGPISHSQASLSHELWKVSQGPRNTTAPSRPPPGLTNNKLSSAWGSSSLGLAQGWSSSYSSEGTTWSTDSSNRTSSWLVLRNLTPQIDGSTLRTLCMQHGPLITFHLNLTQGNAVVCYSSKDEAAKAQKSLHMCVLGNTTILAEFAGEEEVTRFFAQCQSLAQTITSWQANLGTNQARMDGATQSHPIGQWSSGGGGGVKASRGDLLWGGMPQYPSLWGPPGGEDGHINGSPTPIHTLLPGDLLSGESM